MADVVDNVDQLRARLNRTDPQIITLKAATIFNLNGLALVVGAGADVTLEGGGNGMRVPADGGSEGMPILDAGGRSRVAQVSGGGRMVMRHMQLMGGVANDTGGCLHVDITSRLILEEVSVRNCTAQRGGALMVMEGASVEMIDVTMVNVQAVATTMSARGGAVYVEGGEASAIGVSIVDAVALDEPGLWAAGGGLAVSGSGSFTLINTTLSNVRANSTVGALGGGIFARDDATLTLTNMLLASASAVSHGTRYAAGGGICAENTATLTITNATISDASAITYRNGVRAQGGAIDAQGGELILSGVSVVNAIATSTGVATGVATGGALAIRTTKATVVDSIIRDAVVQGQTNVWGAGVMINDAEVALINTTILNVSAIGTMNTSVVRGGGVLAIGDTGRLTVIDCTIAYASVEGPGITAYGGGLFANTEVILMNTIIAHSNSVGNGAGLYVGGGVVTLSNATMLYDNHANGSGHNFYATGGITTYQLPAPPGRWIAGIKCSVFREACELTARGLPSDPLCPATVEECNQIAIANASAVAPSSGHPCQPILPIQPCNWQTDDQVIGKLVQTLPHAAMNDDFPYECGPGLRSSDEPAHQSTALCGGRCEGHLIDDSTACVDCPPGHFCANGKAVACPRGTFAYGPAEARTTIDACHMCPNEQFMTTQDAGTAESSSCICRLGFLSNPNPSEDEPSCIGFPPFLTSDIRNTTMDNLALNRSFWRPGYSSKTAKPCPIARLCEGGKRDLPFYNRYDDSTCAPGKGVSGAYCSLCLQPEKYYDTFADKCVHCDGINTAVGTTGIIALLCVVVFVALAPLPKLHEIRRGFKSLAGRTGLRSKLRIAISFTQVVTQIGEVYDVRFPGEYEVLLNILSVANLQILQLWPSIRLFCIGLQTLSARLAFMTWAPLGVAIVAALVTNLLQGSVFPALPFILYWTYLLFPVISSSGFRALAPCDCFELADGSSECFLREDYEVKCDRVSSASHVEFFQLAPENRPPMEVINAARMAVLVWGICVPLFFFGLLIAAHRERCFCSIEGRALKRYITLLTGGYRPGVIWWELVVVCQKLLLVGFAALYRPGTVSQLALASMLALVVVALQGRIAPYRTPSDNLLAFLASCMLQAIFIFTAILQAQAIAPILEFNGGRALRFMFAATLFVLIATAWIFARECYSSRDRLEIAETGQLPKLELAKRKKYHTFLSHRWDNQDAVATIKRQLQLLLPGVEVFLDIDDLESTDKLEEYVERSAAVLVLLGSVQYFRSPACLRELAAAKQHGLPIIAVHEANISRGGATLDELKAACPPEYLDLIFESGRPIIAWQRAREYQLLSLAQIGEHLLLASPPNESHRELVLSVRHALAWNRPDFMVRPFSLYASPNNPESAEVAAEVRQHYGAAGLLSAAQIVVAEGGPSMSGPDRAARWVQPFDEKTWGWLLFLSPKTFDDDLGKQLAEQVHIALMHGIVPVVVYDADADEFNDIIEGTPPHLRKKLYKPLAIEWRGGEHRRVSIRLVAKAMGATLDSGCGERWQAKAESIGSQSGRWMSACRDQFLSHWRFPRQTVTVAPIEEEGTEMMLTSGLVDIEIPPSSEGRSDVDKLTLDERLSKKLAAGSSEDADGGVGSGDPVQPPPRTSVGEGFAAKFAVQARQAKVALSKWLQSMGKKQRTPSGRSSVRLPPDLPAVATRRRGSSDVDREIMMGAYGQAQSHL